MGELPLKMEVQRWLTGLFSDPMVKTLAKKSNITKTQLETILIDILAEKISQKKIVYEDKAKLRLIKSGVSRGAFNRTLSQARENVIRSIYTVILLGYLGILESPRLDPYIEIANKMNTYAEAYREAYRDRKKGNEHIRVIKMLQEEIERGLQELSHPKSLSRKM